jgi:succinate dehydrogenase hydrophobic anchor subunit
MNRTTTFEELIKKVQQQEDTIVQLVKIIAATNHRISELQIIQEDIENGHSMKQ